MYSEYDRQQLLNQILTFTKSNQEFECVLQIGSGVAGFTDIYSDIDLMAGCIDITSVEHANEKLSDYFYETGAVYLDFRRWTNSVLGISAYWKSGLSVDISFMPTSDIPIRSVNWKLLWASDEKIKAKLTEKTNKLYDKQFIVDDKFHHRFFFTLRKMEVAIHRKNYILADIALCEARQLLLITEAMIEGKNLHQFKAYNTLDHDFLLALQKTYPATISHAELTRTKEVLLSLYSHIICANNLCKIDDAQFMIIKCFE